MFRTLLPSPANKKPVFESRKTGFVCPAWNLQAGANLALAAFITRPQAEASNRRSTHYTAAEKRPSKPGGSASFFRFPACRPARMLRRRQLDSQRSG
jgi:hypothetical protein